MALLTGKIRANGKTALVLFIITSCVYAVMLLVTIPYVMTFSQGMPLLDMMPSGYSHDYVMRLFTALGEDGRKAYRTIQIPVDMVYPGLFGITYSIIFRYFLNSTTKLSRWLKIAGYLPFIAAACDYIENFSFIHMLRSYPEVSQGSTAFARAFSLIKSGSTTVFFLSFIVILIYLVMRRFRSARMGDS